MFPLWFHTLPICSLLVACACAAWILQDIVRHPQRMPVMNVVWPVTALFGVVTVIWGYRRHRRQNAVGRAGGASGNHDPEASAHFTALVGKGALHCGAGCGLCSWHRSSMLRLAQEIIVTQQSKIELMHRRLQQLRDADAPR